MTSGNSLTVQWLGLHASTVGGIGSTPGWGTKILHASQRGQKKKDNSLYFFSVFWNNLYKIGIRHMLTFVLL